VPIYEFYCADCHTVYSFFSQTINTTKRPVCPSCGRPKLERRMSAFAISRGQGEEGGQDEGPSGPDDPRMARALEQLAAEHDGADLDNPRQAMSMIQKMYKIAGMPIPEKAQEIMRRIEAGEDPEKLDEEMGDCWDDEDFPFGEGGPLHRSLGRRAPPRVDKTLYDL